MFKITPYCNAEDADKIKKCPVCGGDVHFHDYGVDTGVWEYMIHCHKCEEIFFYDEYNEMENFDNE